MDANESITFFFDGIRSFGARDGFDDVSPNGRQIQDEIPNLTGSQSLTSIIFEA